MRFGLFSGRWGPRLRRGRGLPGVAAAGGAWPVRCAVWGSPCRPARGLTCPLGPEHMWCRASPRVVLDGQVALLLPYALACFGVMAPGPGRRSVAELGTRLASTSPHSSLPVLAPSVPGPTYLAQRSA